MPILPTPQDSAFRRKLEDELLDPQTTLTAAVKLEALGVSSTRSLRVGLESTSPWVRFAAAEALTYLGQTDGAIELGRLAEDHPAFRAPALKALASMDDAACTDRLAELMGSNDPSLRYGAFMALRLADENNPAVRGFKVNNSYCLHRVAPGSPGLIHLTSDRRCEIALFGDNVEAPRAVHASGRLRFQHSRAGWRRGCNRHPDREGEGRPRGEEALLPTRCIGGIDRDGHARGRVR